MAIQIRTDELQNCQSYLGWLRKKAGISGELSNVLYATDFEWSHKEDDIREKDGLELRQKYAEEMAEQHEKSEQEMDKIAKSVHGKCSVFEVILKLCMQMDAMVNEGESGEMTPQFFELLCKNMGVWDKDDEDFDHWPKETEAFWKARMNDFMQRKYASDGSNGGLFPLKNAKKDQRKEGLWRQMNDWISEHLDEEGVFQW